MRSKRRWSNSSRWTVGLTSVLLAGCGTVKQSSTPRTGTEQILLTNAWDDALQQVDFRPLAGVPIFLDAQFISAIDQGWVTSSLRQAMLAQGVLLRDKPEKAQWIVEARVGAYGTDSYNWLVGIPQTNVPPTLTGIPNGTIPEIPLIKKTDQFGYSKLALFAYDRASGQLVWQSGTQISRSNAKDVYIGGLGPLQSGSIYKDDKAIGASFPLLDDPTPSAGDPSTSKAMVPRDAGLPGSSMALPRSAADLESFKP